jgi:hypothetical protein
MSIKILLKDNFHNNIISLLSKYRGHSIEEIENSISFKEDLSYYLSKFAFENTGNILEIFSTINKDASPENKLRFLSNSCNENITFHKNQMSDSKSSILVSSKTVSQL